MITEQLRIDEIFRNKISSRGGSGATEFSEIVKAFSDDDDD